MKKIFATGRILAKAGFFSIIYLLGFSDIFAQAPINCPKIVFNYDASGNRTQRNLIITPCDVESGRTAEQPPAFLANVYPNPTQDKINIDLQKDSLATDSKIELYDMNGKEIYTATSSSWQIQIDASAYPAGNYLLKVIRGKKLKTFNVSKN